MHRLIMNPLNNLFIDHKDGNGLNNQKENLRICTQAQNIGNSIISKNNKSGIKGVCWDKARNKWRASITINNKHVHLGRFLNINNAKDAYIKAAKEYFGEFYCNRKEGIQFVTVS